jgi:hypothetical protein
LADWNDVGQALLGSWPQQVAAWGREAIAAYSHELRARGVTPDAALTAIRCCGPEQKFPPSAPELAGLARRDPSAPTFEEAYTLIYGRGGIIRARPAYTGGPILEPDKARDNAAQARMANMHSLIASFVNRYGLNRLRMLEVDHPEYGDLKRRELQAAWDTHCNATEGREIAAVASGRHDGLRSFDPLASIRAPHRELRRGEQ